MFGLGIGEILIIFLVGILFFGKGRISDFMGDFAKGIKNFKKGLSEDDTPPPASHKDNPKLPE